MRVSKSFCRQVRSQLLNRLQELCLMSDQQLLEEAKNVAHYSNPEPDRNDLIHWCMKWAIHDALPSSIID